MQKLFENWQKFIKEEEINEVTEEELGDIESILLNLKPSDLPFGDIFGDKMRLVQPLPTQDENLDYLKNILKRSGYTPDFTTGRASYYVVNIPGTGKDARGNPIRPSSMILTGDQQQLTQKKDDETEERYNERMKIIQKKEIKIGKLLQKGSRLFDIANQSYKEFENVKPEDFKVSPDQGSPEDEVNVEKYREKSVELEAKMDTAAGKLQDVFPALTSRASGDINPFQKLANWWNKKSAYYRENPAAGESGESTGQYSVIYSRHPIDVLRMSDFDKIESCHSPRSRGGGGGETYYKCAVAEAHGEGAIAYVVKTEALNHLKEEWGADSDQDLLDKFQSADEELFVDRERDTGEIQPVSRLRLKQYRNPSAEVSLAVPEERVYGRRFPSFLKTVIRWAKDTQAKEIKKLEDTKDSDNPYENAFEDDALNLRNWERYGGTYQDTDDSTLFHNFLGYTTIGSARVDSTTEDNLEINSSVLGEYEQAVGALQEHWNGHYQAVEVHAEVEDHDEEVYISVSAKYYIKIDEDEFVESAFQTVTREAIEQIPDELTNYGYDWLQDYINYTVDGGAVVMEIPFDMDEINPDGSNYAYDPHNFEEICQVLDQKDDQADHILEIAKGVLKRSGILEGAALIKLARALEDESWYEWDYQIDDDWNPTEIEVDTKTYVNFNELIKQIPVKFTTQLKVPTQDFTAELHGSQIAIIETWENQGGGRAYRVRSEEFGDETGMDVANKAAALEYIQWEVSKLILRPPGDWPGQISRSRYESSRDFNLAIRKLMRDEAGGAEGDFAYPNSETWVGGPDADDEYKVEFGMRLTESDPDAVVDNAHTIIVETDDEDILRAIFLKAFAQVLKIPGAAVSETKRYFNKFNLF